MEIDVFIEQLKDAKERFDNFKEIYGAKFGTDPMDDLTRLVESKTPVQVYESEREKYDCIGLFYSQLARVLRPSEEDTPLDIKKRFPSDDDETLNIKKRF